MGTDAIALVPAPLALLPRCQGDADGAAALGVGRVDHGAVGASLLDSIFGTHNAYLGRKTGVGGEEARQSTSDNIGNSKNINSNKGNKNDNSSNNNDDNSKTTSLFFACTACITIAIPHMVTVTTSELYARLGGGGGKLLGTTIVCDKF